MEEIEVTKVELDEQQGSCNKEKIKYYGLFSKL
ncbi:hypothetical protein PRO82_000391 [Candidatus Protochlamydia amoebophila]|nr:hypothetical protein [Candidatus Protochlamydia amoebophila]